MDNGKTLCSENGLFGSPCERFVEWYSNYFCPFIYSAADLILKEIGKEKIDGILLCGSFATGEGTVVLASGRTLFLSDLDIVVVVNSLGVHQSALSEKRNIGNRCERLWPGAEFRGKINVGIYYQSELPGLPPNPGVYDLKNRGILFFGEEDVVKLIPNYQSKEITKEEAVRLIENRIVALLGAHRLIDKDDREDRLELLYGISRVYTDILISSMVFAGEYITGYKNRLEFLERSRDNRIISDLISPGMFKKIDRWTRVKLDPASAETDFNSRDAWEEGASDLLHYWRSFQSASSPYGRKDTIENYLAARKSRYPLLLRLKLWRNYFKSLTLHLWIVRFFNSGKDIYKFTPEELILEYGVRLLYSRIEDGEGSVLKIPPAGFPYDSSEWDKAAGKLYSLWFEFISG